MYCLLQFPVLQNIRDLKAMAPTCRAMIAPPPPQPSASVKATQRIETRVVFFYKFPMPIKKTCPLNSHVCQQQSNCSSKSKTTSICFLRLRVSLCFFYESFFCKRTICGDKRGRLTRQSHFSIGKFISLQLLTKERGRGKLM